MLGHEGVGEVVEIGEKVKYLKPGDRVLLPFIGQLPEGYASAWGTYAEYNVVTDYQAMLDDGLDRLMILLETYFENGGMHAQLSIADTAELQDAQAHPENYPDLMVRVTGYSAVFVDMCRKAQDDIICRDEVS